MGLLRRVENLYSGLPEHHRHLQHERDRGQAALDDFLANPPVPFEHAAELADKQAELNALTLELRMAAESPEVKAKAFRRLSVIRPCCGCQLRGVRRRILLRLLNRCKDFPCFTVQKLRHLHLPPDSIHARLARPHPLVDIGADNPKPFVGMFCSRPNLDQSCC